MTSYLPVTEYVGILREREFSLPMAAEFDDTASRRDAVPEISRRLMTSDLRISVWIGLVLLDPTEVLALTGIAQSPRGNVLDGTQSIERNIELLLKFAAASGGARR